MLICIVIVEKWISIKDVDELKDVYVSALTHRDFTPWHMVDINLNKEKIRLIDAEHATNLNPIFIDFVYFYHRLYTHGKVPN
jgi:hypothetical protein